MGIRLPFRDGSFPVVADGVRGSFGVRIVLVPYVLGLESIYNYKFEIKKFLNADFYKVYVCML